MSPWHLGEMLIQKKLIGWEQLESALEEQRMNPKPIGEILIERGYLAPFLLYKTLAEKHDLIFVDLEETYINHDVAHKIPKSIATKYQIVGLDIQGDKLLLGVGSLLLNYPESEIISWVGVNEVQKVLCIPSALSETIQEIYESDSHKKEVGV